MPFGLSLSINIKHDVFRLILHVFISLLLCGQTEEGRSNNRLGFVVYCITQEG